MSYTLQNICLCLILHNPPTFILSNWMQRPQDKLLRYNLPKDIWKGNKQSLVKAFTEVKSSVLHPVFNQRRRHSFRSYLRKQQICQNAVSAWSHYAVADLSLMACSALLLINVNILVCTYVEMKSEMLQNDHFEIRQHA